MNLLMNVLLTSETFSYKMALLIVRILKSIRINLSASLITATLVAIFATSSFSTEWRPLGPPPLENELAEKYDSFWRLIKKADFESALISGEMLTRSSLSPEYKEILKNIISLINRYQDSVAKNVMRRFVLLEKKRIYWQQYEWWPDNELYIEAVNQIEILLEELNKLFRDIRGSDLEVEVFYRLGLCYADDGRIGPREYKKAIEIFDKITKKYSDSDKVDDAAFEIVLTKLKAERETGYKNITIHDAINYMKEFLSKYPDSNKKLEAQLNLAYLYELEENYQLAEKTLLIIMDKVEDRKLRLKILNALVNIYSSGVMDIDKEKELLKIIIKEFPKSDAARDARYRLEEIRIEGGFEK